MPAENMSSCGKLGRVISGFSPERLAAHAVFQSAAVFGHRPPCLFHSEPRPLPSAHGQWPSISTTTDQLRNVRTTTNPPSMPMLLAVSSSKIVRMTSAAIRNSSDNKSERPSSFLYAGYGSATRVDNCRRKRAEPKIIETTMMTTARSWIPCDDNSIHSRMLLTPNQADRLHFPPLPQRRNPYCSRVAHRPYIRQDVKSWLGS